MKLRRRLDQSASLPLTPLIDMVFLVVIFFMLNASMAINPALEVDLPAAYTSSGMLDEQVVVTIGSDGQVFVAGALVAVGHVGAAIKQEMARTGSSVMLLLADARVPYERIVAVMDGARIVGVQTVSLGTAPAELP